MRRSVPFRWVLSLLLAGFAVGACAPQTAASVASAPAARAADWAVPSGAAPAPISRAEYAQRRAQLAAAMQDGVLVVFGSPEPEADYLPYAQNSPFRYLTGVTEPEATLVMVKSGGTVQEHLFVLPRNPAREVWEGSRLGAEGAEALTGIPARTTDRLRPTLASLLAGQRTLYTLTPAPPAAPGDRILSREQQILAQLTAAHPDLQVVSLGNELRAIRGTKTPAELDLIRRAVYITTLAHRAAQQAIEPGMNEFEIQALIEYTFRRHGADRPAFSSIVGSGPNSTTLHYRDADRYMQAGEVVVIDIGASYRGYAADVTRTYPVRGTFSAEQREIYELVLDAQKAAEALARPGATMQQLSAAADRVLAEGLARLGLIEASDATYDCTMGERVGECPQLRIFYMHGLGHGIGLDVHDPNVSPFAVGSAFTIEPGIYVRADALDYLPDTARNRALIARLRPAVERYQNIGVRIEDDYFITPGGAERVSEGAPREVAEIEALMAQESMYLRDRRPEVVEWYRATTPR